MVYRLFEKGGHRITIRNRDTGIARTRRFFNQKQLDKVISNQNPSEDIYIEKYPKSRLVQVVILDLDSEDDINQAYSDAERCRNYFERHGNNTFIVSSGKKGYHVYIQIAPVLFSSDRVDANRWFDYFVRRMLSGLQKPLDTLDEINSSAGLGGNIRVVGSTHPATGEECCIVEGAVRDFQEPTDLSYHAVQLSYCDCINNDYRNEKEKRLRKLEISMDCDPVAENNLIDVFRDMGCEVKMYDSGYAYTNCIFHSDNNPSLLITENFYSCSGCGAKGNIWTLKKEGLIDWNRDGEVFIV